MLPHSSEMNIEVHSELLYWEDTFTHASETLSDLRLVVTWCSPYWKVHDTFNPTWPVLSKMHHCKRACCYFQCEL